MAARTLLELGVFKHIAEKGRITSQQLSEITKADKILLGIVIHPSLHAKLLTLSENVYSASLLRRAMLQS
jgi:hypothetical protein